MVTFNNHPHIYQDGKLTPAPQGADVYSLRERGMAYRILRAHNKPSGDDQLHLVFDALASHDITYVGIIQTARASGLKSFPVPYVLTNCHNSLCAVGGTINEDDHMFGLSAARKYGGEFVPAHLAVIHQYMREMYAAPGKMILASDSHTRYGPYGTLAIGEGGPELVKQILSRTYDLTPPEVVAVYLTGAPQPGVGPQDVALALIGHVFQDGYVKNKILEFVGPGIANLGMEYRAGIDVMTTETTCLSSIWMTDARTEAQLAAFGRGAEYTSLSPEDGACYDAAVFIDLSKIEPMIALPFHPSNTFTLREFQANAADILGAIDKSLPSKLENGRLRVDQGVVAGCSGGLVQNLRRCNDILHDKTIGDGAFGLSVYPASQPMMTALTADGTLSGLMNAGATIRSAFCGPCFGAGDVPRNGGFSIRHTTRNFPNREGSKPGAGQSAFVALMDARSIAATAANQGILTSAFDLPHVPADNPDEGWSFDNASYRRIYYGVGHPEPEAELVRGPGIVDWPEIPAMPDDLTLEVASALYDEVTTTDELIPSGETSSYRSDPMKLASFTLSRKDPDYVTRAKAIQAAGLTSVVTALRPGDGSAREQAASCQRVLGGGANIALAYATKRYRSNLINWGMLPFIWQDLERCHPEPGDRFTVRGIRQFLLSDKTEISAVWLHNGVEKKITLELPGLSRSERTILLAGCLMNCYAGENA